MTDTEVVIPTRNAPAILWLTLTHLFAFNRRDVAGVTLLDNRSDAPGADAVLAWAASQGCLVVRHERNVGVWASVNRGLALARSRRVLVLTSDVLLGQRAVQALAAIMDAVDVPFLGPEVLTGLAAAPALAVPLPETGGVDTSQYNGACWMMDRERLLAEVGWFDPRFCVAYGDTDYVERMRLADVRYGVVRGVPCVHLDKQSRRAEHTVEEDTEMEIRDGGRFHEKWAAYPEILTRHPAVSRQAYLYAKQGWKEAIPQ